MDIESIGLSSATRGALSTGVVDLVTRAKDGSEARAVLLGALDAICERLTFDLARKEQELEDIRELYGIGVAQ